MKKHSTELLSSHVSLLDFRIRNTTSEVLLEEIDIVLRNGSQGIFLPINAHFVNLVFENPWLREFAKTVDYVVCEGRGVQIAAKILGSLSLKHIRFMDWVYQFFSLAENRGYSMFLLGAGEGTLRKAVQNISARYPRLKIVGAHHGYFHSVEEENDIVIDKINRASPDIVLTGFSMPLEERWLMENKHRMQVKLFILGSGCFEYIAGNKTVCPRWISNAGFEWLYRLLQEPRRLFKRYVIGNPLFLMRVLHQKFRTDERG